MDLQDIKGIVAGFEDSGLATFELEFEDMRLKLTKPCAHPSAGVAYARPATQTVESVVVGETSSEPAGAELTHVKAPLVGIFYSAPSPDAEPFVREGGHVDAGQVVCIVEAMKAMNEIKAPCSGTVISICASDGGLVSYDETLLEIAG